MAKQNLEWFRPLPRRIAITAFVVAWCGFEWIFTHDPLFTWITLGLVVYSIWLFFIGFDERVGPPPPNPPPES
jgi:hypothetical protein